MNESQYLLWPPLLFGGRHLPAPLAAAVFDCGMECALCHHRNKADDGNVANEELLIDLASSLPVDLPPSKLVDLVPLFRDHGYRMEVGDAISVEQIALRIGFCHRDGRHSKEH